MRAAPGASGLWLIHAPGPKSARDGKRVLVNIRRREIMMSSATRDVGTYSVVSPLDRLGAALARNWWLIGLRGVLGVVFGVIALMMPIATILALVLLFSAYMLVDGAFAALCGNPRSTAKGTLGAAGAARGR
jgi:uncharacterized membrane protein